MKGLLEGKNILIMGLRNKWSIAWGAARSANEHGAKLIFTYQGEREKSGVEELISEFEGAYAINCDVSCDEEIQKAFEEIKARSGVLHGVLHSIANAKREDLMGRFCETSRDGFAHAGNVSAYSLIAVSKYAKELMTEGGSVVTLTYLGAERVLDNYNVMGVAKAALEASVHYLASDLGPEGIRVNAVSAGPIKTMSAKGVKDFNSILDVCEKKSPLRRAVNHGEVGDVVSFLMSDMSRCVTGEVIFADNGFNIMGI